MKLTYKQIRTKATRKDFERQASMGLFGYMSKPLIDDLATFCKGKNVLEVYAGRGQLSNLLMEKGISVKATSLRQGHDYTAQLGHVCDVEDIDVVSAVSKYSYWMDVLLVCWPTTDTGLLRSLHHLPDRAVIVFIGEITDYNRKPFPFLGGCATDEFFDAVEEVHELTALIRYPTIRCDELKVFKVKHH